MLSEKRPIRLQLPAATALGAQVFREHPDLAAQEQELVVERAELQVLGSLIGPASAAALTAFRTVALLAAVLGVGHPPREAQAGAVSGRVPGLVLGDTLARLLSLATPAAALAPSLAVLAAVFAASLAMLAAGFATHTAVSHLDAQGSELGPGLPDQLVEPVDVAVLLGKGQEIVIQSPIRGRTMAGFVAGFIAGFISSSVVSWRPT